LEVEKLADRAADIGAYLLDGLRGLMRHQALGDVRGKGFLLGVELVKDRTSKGPVGPQAITAVGGRPAAQPEGRLPDRGSWTSEVSGSPR
jgi:4-aminobutyrate aminotransferase-like enzyme